MAKKAKNTVTVSVTREITFDVEVTLDWEHDDDGCGSPSSSGNSMTGYRGSYLTPIDYDIDMNSVLSAVQASVTLDDDEFTEAASDAADREHEDRCMEYDDREEHQD